MLILRTRKLARGFWRAWADHSDPHQLLYIEAALGRIGLGVLLPEGEGYVSQIPNLPAVYVIWDSHYKFHGSRGFNPWWMSQIFGDAEHVYIGTYEDERIVLSSILGRVITAGKTAVCIETSPERKAEWKEYARSFNPAVGVTFAKKRFKFQQAIA